MSTEARIAELDARLAAMQQRIEVLHSALVTAVSELDQQTRRAAEYLQAVSIRYDRRIDALQLQIASLQHPPVDDPSHDDQLVRVRARLLDAERRLQELEAERGEELIH